MSSAFERGKSDDTRASEAEIDKLHSKIGQLVVERDFFGERLASVARDAKQNIVSADHKLSQRRQYPSSLVGRDDDQLVELFRARLTNAIEG